MPVASVVVEVTTPVATFCRSILALGTAAPELSTTVPVIFPSAACPKTADAAAIKSRTQDRSFIVVNLGIPFTARGRKWSTPLAYGTVKKRGGDCCRTLPRKGIPKATPQCPRIFSQKTLSRQTLVAGGRDAGKMPHCGGKK